VVNDRDERVQLPEDKFQHGQHHHLDREQALPILALG